MSIPFSVRNILNLSEYDPCFKDPSHPDSYSQMHSVHSAKQEDPGMMAVMNAQEQRENLLYGPNHPVHVDPYLGLEVDHGVQAMRETRTPDQFPSSKCT